KYASEISPTVTYAARFWGNHFNLTSDSEAVEFIDAIYFFCKTKLANWVETLSLLNKSGQIPSIAPLATAKLSAAVTADQKKIQFIKTILDDSSRLVSRFSTPLTYNPLQLYQSAIPWLPQSTEFYATYYKTGIMPRVSIHALHGWGPLVLEGHGENLSDIKISADDGNFAVSGSFDAAMKLWDLGTGECIASFEHDDCVNSVAISKSAVKTAAAGFLVAGTTNGRVFVWSLATGKCTRTIVVTGHDDAADVNSLRLSGDDSMLVVGQTGKFSAWLLSTEKQIILKEDEDFESGSFLVGCDAAFTANNTLVLLKIAGNDLSVVDIAGVKKRVLLTGHATEISRAILSADCQFAVSIDVTSVLNVWAVETGQCVASWESKIEPYVLFNLAISGDNKTVALRSSENGLKIWSVETLQCLRSIRLADDFGAIALSGDGNSTVAVDEATVKVFNSKEADEADYLCDYDYLSSDGTVVAFSPARSKTVQVWSVVEHRQLCSIQHLEWIRRIKISADNSFVVVQDGKSLTLWSSETGISRGSISNVDADDFEISDDGLFVVVVMKESVQVWSIETLILRSQISAVPPELNVSKKMTHHASRFTKALLFHKNQKLITGNGQGLVHVWSAESSNNCLLLKLDDLKELWDLKLFAQSAQNDDKEDPGFTSIGDIRFSGDGKFATAYSVFRYNNVTEHVECTWNLENGKCVEKVSYGDREPESLNKYGGGGESNLMVDGEWVINTGGNKKLCWVPAEKRGEMSKWKSRGNIVLFSGWNSSA
ncbi:hypothetical protein HK100_008830, partial [Physocladia obscura]